VATVLVAATGSAAAATFSNPTPITVTNPAGPASPYPSVISASGLNGTVSDVNVGLHGYSAATNSEDAQIALVAPGGQALLLWNTVGNGAVSNLELTIDDSAAAFGPPVTALTSGSYKPTSNLACCPPATFPSPGPGTSYGTPGPGGTATLASAFNGTSPNGTWALYVNNRSLGVGSFAGGWDLTIAVTPPPAPPATAKKKKCKKHKKKRSAAAAKKKCKKKKK
jgi:hypothetical protein